MRTMLAIDILTGPIALMLIGYVVVMVALSYAVQPLRERLVILSEQMLDETHWSDAQRDEIELMVTASMSFRVGLIMPIAVASIMADTILDRKVAPVGEQAELEKDPRFEAMTWRFFVSAAAANPLAAIPTVALMLVSIIVGLAFAKRSSRSVVETTVEEPMIRVLSSVAPGRRLSTN
jgi:hypothetical protein